jgi:Family of unknown function (DUF6941)
MSLTVRSAMLADAAALADGKLYIHGGQWDTIRTHALPIRHPSLSIVVVVEVPYDEALAPHTVEVTLENDGRSDPSWPRFGGQLQTGHAPNSARGASSFVSMPFTVTNLELPEPGRYEWVISLDGERAQGIVMTVMLVPQAASGAPPPGPSEPT